MRRALRTVFGDARLRRVALAFAGFNAAEWAVWIALLVYAYDHGGAATASLAVVVQLLPSGLFALLTAGLADRRPPARVLLAGYLAQAAAMGTTALALATGAPLAVVLAGAAAAATAVTITRPAQAALLPALVRGIDELTAANVVLGWIESLTLLVAPAAAGALMAVSGPAAVFAVMAAVAAGSAALVAGVRGPAAPARRASERDDEADGDGGLRAVLRVVGCDRQARLLAGVLCAEFVLIGALDVLFVVLAIDVLGLGDGGAGYLNAAFGLGGVAGIAATVRLIGRPRLMPALLAAAALWSGALVVLGASHAVPVAFALLAVAGAGRTVLDVATRTLLQRSVPTQMLARVFGVLEMLDAAGLALGGLLVAVLVGVLGPQAAATGLAAVLPLVFGLTRRGLRGLDEGADVPLVEIALLRSHPLFAALRAPALEGLARALTPLQVRAGECLIREGQPGRGYYLVAGGRLEVSRASVAIGQVGPGDGVGEISLLARVPCTATVTALTAVQIYAIAPQRFVDVIAGHATSAARADALVRDRLLQTSAST